MDVSLNWINLDTCPFSECLSNTHLSLAVLVPNSCWLSRTTTSVLHKAINGQAAGRVCHSSCVGYSLTNVLAVKGQVTDSQTHRCQLNRQITVCLKLKLTIWLKILSSQILWLQQEPSYSKVKTLLQTPGHIPSKLWVTAGYWFSPNNPQHSNGSGKLFLKVN